MLTDDFGFTREPFAIKPDPELVFSHTAFRKVCADILVAHLSQRRGLVLVTGAPGVGKSTLLLKLLAERQIAQSCVYLSCRASPSFEVLVDWWCEQLDIAVESREHKARGRALVEHLTRQQGDGGSSALLLDDAGNLDQVTLENLRGLAELESGGRPLVQIILAAQARDSAKAEPPVSAFSTRLDPVEPLEVGGYLLRRLSGAGYDGPSLFSASAIQRIAQVTQGNPRLINGLCQEALSLAARQDQTAVSALIVEQVLQETPTPAAKTKTGKEAPIAAEATSPRRQGPTGLPPEAVWPIPFAAMPGEDRGAKESKSGRARAGTTSLRFAAGLLVGLVIGAVGLSILKATSGPEHKFSWYGPWAEQGRKPDAPAPAGQHAVSKEAPDSAIVRKIVIVEQTAEGLYALTPENSTLPGGKQFLPSPPPESEPGFIVWLQDLLDQLFPNTTETTKTAQRPEG